MATIGIVLYMVSMWVAGINQGLMLRAFNPDGSLQYPNFVETLVAIRPMYIVRALGGLLFLSGFLLMAWNLAKQALRARRSTAWPRWCRWSTVKGPSPLAILAGRPASGRC